MKHLIVGDVHGFHTVLRNFLKEMEVIDAQGEPINRDQFKVYCVGDLIDGEINRSGDIMNLETAEKWFDAVCLGNHEYAFLGGKEFTGARRKHDRTVVKKMLELIDKNIYVPSILINDEILVTHGGLHKDFDFDTARDAWEYIDVMWKLKPELDDDVAIFDHQYTGTTSDPIFQLNWSDKRNDKFTQVVGHSTFYTGPVYSEYESGIVHWNIDVGTKHGTCAGGIIFDDESDKIELKFYGDRYETGFTKNKKTYPPKGDVMTYDPKVGQSQKATPKSSPVNGEVIHTPTTGGIKNPLTEADIALIEDPHILDVFRAEVKKGNSDLRLIELIEDLQ